MEDTVVKLRDDFKISYDATVFVAYFFKNFHKFFIDRHGNGFLLTPEGIMEGENKFSYGVNVTGVVCYG